MTTTVTKKEPEAFDPWKTPKESWQYITMPTEDPLGKPFPTVRLNKEAFEAGQTYQVPAAIATFVNDRVKIFNRSCVRLLQADMSQDGIIRTADGAAAPMPTL